MLPVGQAGSSQPPATAPAVPVPIIVVSQHVDGAPVDSSRRSTSPPAGRRPSGLLRRTRSLSSTGSNDDWLDAMRGVVEPDDFAQTLEDLRERVGLHWDLPDEAMRTAVADAVARMPPGELRQRAVEQVIDATGAIADEHVRGAWCLMAADLLCPAWPVVAEDGAASPFDMADFSEQADALRIAATRSDGVSLGRMHRRLGDAHQHRRPGTAMEPIGTESALVQLNALQADGMSDTPVALDDRQAIGEAIRRLTLDIAANAPEDADDPDLSAFDQLKLTQLADRLSPHHLATLVVGIGDLTLPGARRRATIGRLRELAMLHPPSREPLEGVIQGALARHPDDPSEPAAAVSSLLRQARGKPWRERLQVEDEIWTVLRDRPELTTGRIDLAERWQLAALSARKLLADQAAAWPTAMALRMRGAVDPRASGALMRADPVSAAHMAQLLGAMPVDDAPFRPDPTGGSDLMSDIRAEALLKSICGWLRATGDEDAARRLIPRFFGRPPAASIAMTDARRREIEAALVLVMTTNRSHLAVDGIHAAVETLYRLRAESLSAEDRMLHAVTRAVLDD